MNLLYIENVIWMSFSKKKFIYIYTHDIIRVYIRENQ